MDQTASMFDIAQMVARARSGLSAHTYKPSDCPAGVSSSGVNVRLGFNAWPSSPDLEYTLEASIGAVSPAEIVSEYTEFSTIFEKKDTVDLKFILTEMSVARWEKGCWAPIGQRITPEPAITLDGFTTLRTSEPVFGVARIRGQKWGAKHTITHTLIKSYPVRPDEPLPEEGITADKLEEYWGYTDVVTWDGETIDRKETVNLTGLSIENLSISVTAKWLNAAGEEESYTLQLKIPQCVQDLLANCDGNLENFGGAGSGSGTSGTSICDLSDNPEHTTVYVSGCSGAVLDKRTTKDDPDSWCE